MDYHNYTIKKGKFIGKFEDLYRACEDPWNLLLLNKQNYKVDYKIVIYLALKAGNVLKKKKIKTLEVGCGFPQISNELQKLNFDSYGTDISATVINKSIKKYKKLKNKLFVNNLDNYDIYKKINPDIFIMSNITWYVLPQLNLFLKYLKKNHKNKYLIHSLSVYGKKQKYGNNFFTNLNEITKYFNLKYITTGELINKDKSGFTFFLAKI
jgi:predicted TPR repeat methyltransferase